MQTTFKIAHLITHFELLHNQGVRLSDIIKGSGITTENAMNPYCKINFDQQEILYKNICRLNDDPMQGFKAGIKRNLACFGIPMQAVLSSKNFLDAQNRAHILEPIYAPHLQKRLHTYKYKDGSYVSKSTYTATLKHSKPIITESSLTMCKLAGDTMIGKQIQLKLLRLSYKKPNNHSCYEDYFRCPVEFNCENTEIWIDSKLALTPSILWNESFADYAEKLSLTKEKESQELFEFIASVRNAINNHPIRYPNLSQVSDHLCMSQRTVHRKLAKCNTAYQKIIDDIKLNYAKRYILHTSLSIEDIAEEAGFASSSSFRVAFKKWTELTPTEYKKNHIKINDNSEYNHTQKYYINNP